VGEIDHDTERLAQIDALHPPRNDRETGEPLPDAFRVEPEGVAEGDDRQRVVHVEAPREPKVDRRIAGRRDDVGVDALRSSLMRVARMSAAGSVP
jgi:hypothetical protein